LNQRKVQIVGHRSSGMAHDIALIEQEFKNVDIDSTITIIKKLGFIDRVIRKLGFHWFRPKRFKVNVFIQQVESWWMPDAYKNCVIPNQEWFTPYGVALLSKVDEVWCKSREAERIFSELGCRCLYLGFTSNDRMSESFAPRKNYREFLHIGSNSIWKGTKVLVDAWMRHPEWPTLTVLSRTLQLNNVDTPKNLIVINEFISESQLLELQNNNGIYIHPTEMEGFGHAICEAMSTSAVVITSDAPPMNELISTDRGLLIPILDHSKTHNLGGRYFVSVEAIESAVERVLAMPESELIDMGSNARAWFEKNQTEFKQRFRAIVLGESDL
jgi:glycosyltransferase involved in cell wall biosynthesis